MPKAIFTENIVKSPLRALKYRWLYWSAEQRARKSHNQDQICRKPVAFVIGCGRSGTTVLGQILSNHLQVNYLFEPYHLWAAIERRTDVLNLFHQVDASLIMDALHYNQQSQIRFDRLIRSARGSGQARLVIEKTPLNALRIGYIEAIAPGSKFIHIVRDGAEVCHSIETLAGTNSYKIAGKPALNQWWGVDYAKWKTLMRDGMTAGYYAEEIHCLDSHLSKGAYEWLVSLGEIDRWREPLGDRLQEFTYDALTTQPKVILKNLCEFLEIDILPSWLDKAVSVISSRQHKPGLTVSLPPAMREAFNNYQQRYEFPNRATCWTKD